MRFAFCVEQNVTRFDVTMQNSVFMRVMHSARDLRDEFHRLPDRDGLAPDDFVELSAFDEFHAEVARAIPFAYFVNWNNTGMLETRGSFRFQAETFHVRFARPLTKAMIFSATVRLRLFCRARYTTPWLPRPISSSSW